jgi:hypothetical protein
MPVPATYNPRTSSIRLPVSSFVLSGDDVICRTLAFAVGLCFCVTLLRRTEWEKYDAGTGNSMCWDFRDLKRT